MKKLRLATLFLVVLLVASCNKNKDNDKKVVQLKDEEISEWIYENMQYIYFWNYLIPQGLNPLTESDPAAFYESLLYREEDKWSFITSDYTAFEAELDGVPESMGYSPAFGLFRNSDKVFIVVEYVYPGTPASEAGLKRGDIIMTIDGSPMDTTNYLDLYKQSSYTAGLGIYDGESITLSGETVSMVSRVISADPVLHHEIIDPDSSKIGYIAYAEFISGATNEFVNSLDLVISDFLNSGVRDLIVDLRYNPGGQINMAGYLASSIAPASTIASGSVLVKLLYNSFLTEYYTDRYGPESEEIFNYHFPGSNFNLNLDRVYFLTTKNTASASELVISGLEPYMEVNVVGDSTYGKYTGAWVYPDTESPPRHNWAIIPIVLKYANADDFTNFKDGLLPDYYVEDNLLEAYPFGDVDDPMIATAVNLIKGTPLKRTGLTYRPYRDLAKPGWDLKSNLYLDHPEFKEDFRKISENE